ncbi:unnamed protein product [Miscanthus lutarioriparius]|uniref:Uncharacterized protein n=1 Tax=Miscanthus lutarioriparius TaxID=422564 RepID=A0A811PYA2_9POAL|nr:unnamed protein product [Miscanthus lutarioriparius]
MLARAPPRPCSTGGEVAGYEQSAWWPGGGVGLAQGAARCPGRPRAAAGVRMVAARPGPRTTTVVAAAAGERRTAAGSEPASAEAANGSSSAVAGTVVAGNGNPDYGIVYSAHSLQQED